jgi:hypothetical protein
MAADFAHNEYAQRARSRKARALADLLLEAGASTEIARAFTDAEWRALARAAEVNAPSEETRRLVRALLRADEEERSRPLVAGDGRRGARG